MSTFFAAAYVGLGLPALLTGLISQLISTVDASAWTSGLAAAIVVAAIIIVLRSFGKAPAPTPPCTPSDSWCSPQEPASTSAGQPNRSSQARALNAGSRPWLCRAGTRSAGGPAGRYGRDRQLGSPLAGSSSHRDRHTWQLVPPVFEQDLSGLLDPLPVQLARRHVVKQGNISDNLGTWPGAGVDRRASGGSARRIPGGLNDVGAAWHYKWPYRTGREGRTVTGPETGHTIPRDVLALYGPLLARVDGGLPVDRQVSLLVDEAVTVWSRPGFDTFLSLPSLRFTPFDYQLQAARGALRRMRGRAILADEVGLGKTIEAGLILAELRLRGLADRTLVIVPAGLVTQWQEELERKFGVPRCRPGPGCPGRRARRGRGPAGRGRLAGGRAPRPA